MKFKETYLCSTPSRKVRCPSDETRVGDLAASEKIDKGPEKSKKSKSGSLSPLTEEKGWVEARA